MLLARHTLLKGIAGGYPASPLRERLDFAAARGISIVPSISTGGRYEHNKPDVGQLRNDLLAASSSHDGNTGSAPPGRAAPRHFTRQIYQLRPRRRSRRHKEFKQFVNARVPVYLRFSPARSLAHAIEVFFHGGPWNEACRQSLREVSGSDSLRLPVLTVQLMLRDDETLHKKVGSCDLPNQEEWEARLEYIAAKGIKEDDIAHWIWILSAPSGDRMVRRFLSTDAHKPMFLLLILLDPGNRFRIQQIDSLKALLDFISKEYVLPRFAMLHRPARRSKHRSLDRALSMTAVHFARLLERLVQQALNLWPAALVTIAHIVASFIESIPSRTVSQYGFVKDGHAARCLVLNRALEALARPARRSPFRHAKHNWDAQRVLLALANRLEPRLIINLAGYRAVRLVLLRLRKSHEERRVARRYARTWPPYRMNWDGVDEQRTPQDDLSRSAKAGVLMIEAGYGEAYFDRALTALGGGQVYGSPTIQTRSLSPVLWTRRLASLNIYSAWASEVRATRNATEAWAVFNTPPSLDLTPNIQVYAAMFEKLFAKETDSSLVLPGDTTREVFASHDANLSAFEKARLQPPSYADLYRRMRHDGVDPVGSCLVQLIMNAESVEMATQYLKDSPFSREATALARHDHNHGSIERLRRLPMPIFNAWISLLCQLEERELETPDKHHRDKIRPDYHVFRAFTLCKLVLHDRTYRPPWYSILGALAGAKFTPLRYTNRLSNFLQIFDFARRRVGADPILLEQLGLFLQKHLQSVAGAQLRVDAKMRRDVEILKAAHQNLVALFEDVTGAVPQVDHVEMPILYHDITPMHLYRYMRALASFGDADGMVRAMRWILRAWELDTVLEEAKTPEHFDHKIMAAIFSHFNDVGDRLVSAGAMQAVREEAQRLVEDAGCTWVWLRPELVESEQPLDVMVAQRWMVLRKDIFGAVDDQNGE